MQSKFDAFRSGCHARVSAIDGRITRTLIWIAVGLFILGFANWATRAGIQIRDDAWTSTRSIRYQHDIGNALHWGDQVLQAARNEPGTPASSAANSQPGFWQIVRAEGHVYDGLVNGTGGDYQLDYPPLRLLTMTLWTRHVQEAFPNLSEWPGRWRQGQQPSEEIAAPLVHLNALLTWLSSVFAFFLVWLWVDRGGRQGATPRVSPLAPRRPLFRTSAPLTASAGLLLFPPLSCLFFYALLVAVSPCPAPPPMVNFSGPTILSHGADGISATIHAAINPQGAGTRWSAEWGTEPGDYSHITRGDDVGDGSTPTEAAITISNLPADSQVHYRVTARNDSPNQGRREDRDLGRGVTHTDDGILLTSLGDAAQPAPPNETYNSAWLSLWQWLGVLALLGALGGSIHLLPPEHRGWACGLLAAMLLWLNPAIMLDGHVWPQWEIWVLPPFLLAALLASLEWWFTAGLIFGIGMMFKGQFLIGAPVLLLWPLLSLRWGAFFRLIGGIVLCSGLLLSPWLTLGIQPFSWSLPAVQWIVRVVIAAAIASLLPLLRVPLMDAIRSLWGPRTDISLKRVGLVAGAVAAALIAMIALILAHWPRDAELQRSVGLWLFLAVLILPWLMRRRWLGVFTASVAGVAIWMSAWLYHGNWAWETVGYEYGATKFDTIAMGHGSNGNLASILAQHFGWELHDQATTLQLPNLSGVLPAKWLAAAGLNGSTITLELRQLLIAIFASALAACAAGAAINDRRNHPRFLAALVAPWMLMPNILGQMMCRYQTWGAALSCLLVGISPGFTLVNVLFSILATGMVANQLLGDDPSRSPQMHQILSNLAPEHGWIMLCMAVLVLYVAVVPGQSSEPRTTQLPVELPSEDSTDDFDFVTADEPPRVEEGIAPVAGVSKISV